MSDDEKLTNFAWGTSYLLFNGEHIHVEQLLMPQFSVRGKRVHRDRSTTFFVLSGRVLIRMFNDAGPCQETMLGANSNPLVIPVGAAYDVRAVSEACVTMISATILGAWNPLDELQTAADRRHPTENDDGAEGTT